MSVPLSVHLQN